MNKFLTEKDLFGPKGRYPEFIPQKKWIVNVHGDKKQGEISVVWGEYPHGFASWGWFGNDKVMIACTDHQWGFNDFLWNAHIKLAHDYAIKLNKRDT